MHSLRQSAGSQGGTPAPARSASALDAENARLDAQLELAAKKAALAGMQRAGVGADAQPPAAPPAPEAPVVVAGTPGTRIVYEKDGKTIVLDNPTTEQLQQIGIAAPQRGGDVSGWQLVALTGAVVWAIVTIVWMFLGHRRRVMGVGTTTTSASATDARMARIENAIESVAVEVERISEGQRYTSKLLSEGAAQPVNGAVNVPDILGAVLKNRGGG